MPKRTATISLSATLFVVVIGIGVPLYSMWPKQLPSPAAPTKEISKTNSIGGTLAKPESQGGQSKQPHESSTNVTPVPARAAKAAPKQQQVKDSVAHEYPYYALGASNDPLTQTSWALTNTHAYTAWDQSTNSGGVVAVIDSGFALAHQDLSSQWYVNTGETGMTTSSDTCWTGTPADKATNGCDDDQNGYVDDWRGWNFVASTNNPQAGQDNPNGAAVSHGTEVAGLVGAAGNNGVGIATFAWNTKIMPLKALSDDGVGYTSNVAAAIYYAVDSGADVINMSLGGPSYDQALADAINYAYAHNVVVVAAAGNCGTGQESGCNPNNPGAMGYPALNNHVISVGATTSNNSRASFSSYGPGLDVVAPGSGTLVSPMWQSSNQTSAYAGSLYGTSFASPMVASYVALIKSLRGTSTVDDITAIVDGTAQKVSGMSGAVFTDQYGHGLIDASAALTVASNLASPSATAPTLQQSGGNLSEHRYSSATLLSSSCTVSAGSFCTIWAQDDNGYDRYLPYTFNATSGETDWGWAGSNLGPGEWKLYARSGDSVSQNNYYLVMK